MFAIGAGLVALISVATPVTAVAGPLHDEVPTVTMNPASQQVAEGAPASFSAGCSDPSASIVWEVSHDQGSTWSTIPGVQTTTFTIQSVTSDWNGAWVGAVFTNGDGSIATSAAIITVTESGPTISRQPASASVNAGADATFEVVATGVEPMTVQWRRSDDHGHTWSDIAGATDARLTLTSVSAEDSGAQFLAVVTSGNGTATSQTATLTVTAVHALTIMLAPAGEVTSEGVEPGTTKALVASVRNTGSADVFAAKLTITAGKDLTLATGDAAIPSSSATSAVSPTTTQGAPPDASSSCQVSASIITCDLGTMAGNATVQVPFAATVDDDAVPGAVSVKGSVEPGATNGSGSTTMYISVKAAQPSTDPSPTASAATTPDPFATDIAQSSNSAMRTLVAIAIGVCVILLAGGAIALAVYRSKLNRDLPNKP